MKLLVGLSGGVDSAVAAHLLMEQGHEIVAGFMLNYLDESNPNCSTKADLESFHQVRQHLNIPYEIFDYRDEYEQLILNYIFEGYQRGITPSPDVYCNSLVKFELFAQEARQMGFDGIVTGHYAKIVISEDSDKLHHLYRGVDHHKDQSYFLSQLSQIQLSFAHLPLGDYTKPQIRQIAHDIGLPNANRPDSQGLCFVGNISMSDFLHDKLGDQPGAITILDGTVVGHHTGAYQYTVGQRRNLRLPFQAYVVATDPVTNTVIVTSDPDDPGLYTESIHVHHWHWIAKPRPNGFTCHCKIRYRQNLQDCTIRIDRSNDLLGHKNNVLSINIDQPIKGAAAGQIVVCYDGEEVIGSGVIGGK